MSRSKREQVATDLKKARDDAQAARDKLNGNPNLVAAIESLESRVRAIESYMNLDVADNA